MSNVGERQLILAKKGDGFRAVDAGVDGRMEGWDEGAARLPGAYTVRYWPGETVVGGLCGWWIEMTDRR